MDRSSGDHTAAHLLADLIRLLNQGAPAADFSRRLAQAETLPDAARRAETIEAVRMAMAVRARMEHQQQRERGMLAVSESAQDLSSRLERNDLLQAIVVRARTLLGSHVAWLSIYDPEAATFHALVADGALSQGTARMSAARDRGIAGVVMSTRLPFTTTDYLHDTRFGHDAALDDTFREEGIAAVVGVPLVWDGQVIGLLFVADRYHRTHDAPSISILCTLAAHGAVAIRNAMAFEEASAALRKAEAARAALEQHTRGVQAAAAAHEQLTSLLARGASLAVLVDSVAGLLGGAVIVVDEASQPMARAVASERDGAAAAAEAAEAYAPHGPRSAAIARALSESRSTGRSVPVDADGDAEASCRVMAVIGGDDMLGAILLFRREALDEVSIRTFERASSVIGVVLLSRERMEAAKTRDAAALLLDLVSFRQDDPAALRHRAERVGIDLDRPVSLVLVDVDAHDAGPLARRLRGAVSGPGVLFDERAGVVSILCATTRAAEVVERVVALPRQDARGAFRGVLSRPILAVEEIPALHATVKRALAVLKRIGVAGRVVTQNEMALYSVLFETHDRESLRAFLETTIGGLLAHDEKRGSELAATLLRYFDHNQNAREAALALGIHVNTMRQRLGTVEELIGHWGQASRALELHVALRLWSLLGP